MSEALKNLLFNLRQDPAFKEFMSAVEAPEPKEFRPTSDPQAQWADYIFRSGRRLQHNAWRQFLIGEPSQQEKS